jgi:hypothetical protein
MAISIKRAPIVEDSQVSRAISMIYDDINELIDAVNRSSTSEKRSGEEGKAGDIRVVKDADGLYYLEARTEEGWIQNVDSVALSGDIETIKVGFRFRDKGGSQEPTISRH